MRLLVIGHTAHYLVNDHVVGWGPTVKEINWLAQAFDSVVHLACLHPGTAPASALPYESDRIQFIGLPPAGGLNFPEKLRAMTIGPRYVRAILNQTPQADIIQIRTPGILGMYGLLMVSLFCKKPRWTKYAGNWDESKPMPLSFRFQRGWLKMGFSRGPVTINGRWPGQQPFLFSFLNPSLSLEEIGLTRRAVANKQLSMPVRLVFAGRIEAAKGPLTTIKIARSLLPHLPFHLDILGDGPDLGLCQEKVRDYGLGDHVSFRGWVPHLTVQAILSQAHFVLLPSLSEGWPKIISEGMANGAVPVVSNVSTIPQTLSHFKTGFAVPPTDIQEFCRVILETSRNPDQWKDLSSAGIKAAPWFSYEKYLIDLDGMLADYYGLSMLKQPPIKAMRETFQEAIQ